MAGMQGMLKVLERHAREEQRRLIGHRRSAGAKRRDIDELLGEPEGWTKAIEARGADPRMSDLHRYRAAIHAIDSARQGR